MHCVSLVEVVANLLYRDIKLVFIRNKQPHNYDLSIKTCLVDKEGDGKKWCKQTN